MTWSPYYTGSRREPLQLQLPPPPPWRDFAREAVPGTVQVPFEPPEGLVEAVNAALCLRRPLLLTGAPGTGKSTVAASVAYELGLGSLLRWHITSRSTLVEALYRYDALGRLDAARHGETDDLSRFVRLGPLGTALLPAQRSRALLIDEIDKSDIDLPSDLLDVLERGVFEIPELSRHEQAVFLIREWDGDAEHEVRQGRVHCEEFPFIVLTSNGEREFPAPFLRRCIRFTMPDPTYDALADIVRAHLGELAQQVEDELLHEFAQRLRDKRDLATDQLLNAVFLVTRDDAPGSEQRQRLIDLLLRGLSST